MLVVQNSRAPGNIRNAVADLVSQGTVGLHIASAYTTLAGSRLLLDLLANSIGRCALSAIPKTLITCFDFGITEPHALRFWLDMSNTQVCVAGTLNIEPDSMVPSSAFHPKIYAFENKDDTSNILVGSANLTARGFTVNSEVAWSQCSVPMQQVQNVFKTLTKVTERLTDSMLNDYEKKHEAQTSSDLNPEGTPVSPIQPDDSLRSFREAVESNSVDPTEFSAMWLYVDTLQGGSANQLELPRGGHKFFGFSFSQYDSEVNREIGMPTLRRGRQLWDERSLTWHGGNRMERLYLPTKAQGGPGYADSVIMFRRLEDDSFELIVSSEGSDLANAWMSASQETGNIFSLGDHTTRLVGLL